MNERSENRGPNFGTLLFPLLPLSPFFFILISSYTIYILFCNLSSTPGFNLDIVEDKNCTREDEYCQRGDKIVKRR